MKKILNWLAVIFIMFCAFTYMGEETEGANFERSVTKTLKEEGSAYYYSAKYGERSKYGITYQTLMHFNRKYSADWYVKELKLEQAEMIYYELYWKPIRLSEIKNPWLADNIFDFGVNSGLSRSIKTLQQVLNEEIKKQKLGDKLLKVDGNMGTQTIKMANKYGDDKFVKHYKKHRMTFLKSLGSKWRDYRYNWTRRVKNI